MSAVNVDPRRIENIEEAACITSPNWFCGRFGVPSEASLLVQSDAVKKAAKQYTSDLLPPGELIKATYRNGQVRGLTEVLRYDLDTFVDRIPKGHKHFGAWGTLLNDFGMAVSPAFGGKPFDVQLVRRPPLWSDFSWHCDKGFGLSCIHTISEEFLGVAWKNARGGVSFLSSQDTLFFNASFVHSVPTRAATIKERGEETAKKAAAERVLLMATMA